MPDENSTNKTDPIPGLASNSDNSDYKKKAYLHSSQYANRLKEEKDLDQTLKQYLRGNMPWTNVAEHIATEESKRKGKGPRIRKSP